MTSWYTAFFFLLLSLGASLGVVTGRDRMYVACGVVLGWIVLASLTSLVNARFPFAISGADDTTYYILANTPINGLADIFDLGKFQDEMEQPGFPWLLSLLNAITGRDLLAYKFLNLFFFMLTALVWYRIAIHLASIDFARKVFVACLCLSPLWYYVFFLLKDMIITFLQSVFLLGMVTVWRRGNALTWLQIISATFVLLLFRSPLILLNCIVIIVILSIKTLQSLKSLRSISIIPVLLGFIASIALLYVASNPALMSSLGISSEARVLGSEEMGETFFAGTPGALNIVSFSIYYLFTELTAFNPMAWQMLDPPLIRGLLAMPWILLVVPFFLVGLRWLWQVPRHGSWQEAPLLRLLNRRIFSSPWLVLAIFLVCYIMISWKVSDTTRWRLPDMPVIATIAVAGWDAVRRSRRLVVVITWWCLGAVLFSLFYLAREML